MHSRPEHADDGRVEAVEGTDFGNDVHFSLAYLKEMIDEVKDRTAAARWEDASHDERGLVVRD
ncbi:hypothetical protein GCM10027161_58380 [Microbispora hainanensis]